VGVHSVGQMWMCVIDEQVDSVNEFGGMNVRETDSSSLSV
jgi:hypothetical protein